MEAEDPVPGPVVEDVVVPEHDGQALARTGAEVKVPTWIMLVPSQSFSALQRLFLPAAARPHFLHT